MSLQKKKKGGIMLKRTMCLMVMLCGILLLGGCSQNVARFSIVSTGNIQMDKLNKGDTIEGEDCITFILGFPIGNTTNRISGAVANALEVAHGSGQPSDALVNVDVSMKYWSAVLFGRNCVVARGQPVSTR